MIDGFLEKLETTHVAGTMLHGNNDQITPETVANGAQSVGFAMTKNCNIHCNGCYIQGAGGETLSPDRINDALTEAPKAGIALGGGDPFMCTKATVDAVRLIVQQHNRHCTIVTNGLLFNNPRIYSQFVDLMGNDQQLWKNISFAISVDSMHQAGSRVSLAEYARIIGNTARLLTELGSRVTTNSVLLNPEQDIEVFNTTVLPLLNEGIVSGISASPNMFDPYNNDSISSIEELMTRFKLLSPSKQYIQILKRKSPKMKTAPWSIVEVDPLGVVGPSPYYREQNHFKNILEMYRYYQWSEIYQDHPLETTVTQSALSWMQIGNRVFPNPKYYMRAVLAALSM
jgi:hypothetical protein